jgi:pimeloyl-ACP methyl ester carboxylesterase
MKTFKLIILFTFLILYLPVNSQTDSLLKPAGTFFPEWKELNKENIRNYSLSVPENWSNAQGKKIKLAITVIKSLSPKSNASILFLQGGPGGGAINGLWRWLKHPLRNNNDIILVDIRGTGFSEPKLCPDLGKAFFAILAKNQSAAGNDSEKVSVSLQCQQDLIDRGIDINSYNSEAVTKDLNAMKTALHISKWHVYGVSYGTHIAQEYAAAYPTDILSMILDSPIPDIAKYYNKNPANFNHSLEKFFQACREDAQCNSQYPEIKQIYYSVLNDLTQRPVTVKIDKNIVPSGEFTYNAEDFKIAVQQSLYNRKLIEILPAIIYQFHKRNTSCLSELVSAFSGALSLDYGTYYCFSCKEVIPYNNIDSFNAEEAKYKGAESGLNFYKSDFMVCREWNKNINITEKEKNKDTLTAPVLILSGEFDPITPGTFAALTAKKYPNSTILYASTYGHGPGSSDTGSAIIANFVNKGITKGNEAIYFEKKKVAFRYNLSYNKGVGKFGKSVNKPDWLFFFPLILAILNILGYTVYHVYSILFKKTAPYNLLRWLFPLTSLLAIGSFLLLIIAVFKTYSLNYFILALGLPGNYGYVFLLQKFFLILSILVIGLTILKWKKMAVSQLYVISLFSIVIINTYYYYWGFYF